MIPPVYFFLTDQTFTRFSLVLLSFQILSNMSRLILPKVTHLHLFILKSLKLCCHVRCLRWNNKKIQPHIEGKWEYFLFMGFRMPCVEVGDSVVSKGRETLERCIDLIEGRPEWGARVVYGDTDSVFVLLPGKSKDQAFGIGDEMARAVTLANPKPVKLKFEKVYQPCILQVGSLGVSRGNELVRLSVRIRSFAIIGKQMEWNILSNSVDVQHFISRESWL